MRLKAPRPITEIHRRQRAIVWRRWYRAIVAMVILGIILAAVIVAVLHAARGDLSSASTVIGAALAGAVIAFTVF